MFVEILNENGVFFGIDGVWVLYNYITKPLAVDLINNTHNRWQDE